MPLDLQRFMALRPRLFHLTAAENAERIIREGVMRSAAATMGAAGRSELIRTKRPKGVWVECPGGRVHVRDQRPLYSGNVALADGWVFEDLVEYLNRQVYFWPGGGGGPISYGMRHFGRYRDEGVRVMSVDTRALFERNAEPGPRFSRFNSGSPRCTGGRRSPRGPGTFAPGSGFAHRPGEVVEVVFEEGVRLDGCDVRWHDVGEFFP